MANRSRTHRRAVSFAARKPSDRARPTHPQGRLDSGPPVAVIDIGSNSVRLVVYEGLARNLTPLFNEKVMAGLGREVQTTGLIAPEAITIAYNALRRFRALCDTLKAGRVLAIATAACRDARNGPEFLARARKICRVPIRLLSGPEEARMSALGVASGVYRPDGIVADLGGGSLELIDIVGKKVRLGATLPLGGLALQDVAGRSLKRAQKLAATHLAGQKILKAGRGRTLYAVGGTWRALARLHMWQHGYPLHVMHGYVIPATEAIAFCRSLQRGALSRMRQIKVVNKSRRLLLPYAAAVMERLLRESKASHVVISVFGVREGLLYSMLGKTEQAKDALICASEELNLLRSRAPKHGDELVAWTDALMRRAVVRETPYERRLRHAACLLADVGWRAHPDYRGEQSLNIIANAGFGTIDHPGRAYLALAVYFRYAGPDDSELSPRITQIASPRLLERARILAAAMRVAYVVSASQTGVLPKTHLVVRGRTLVLQLDRPKLAVLGGDRVLNRLKQLSKLLGMKAAIEVKVR